MDASLFYGNLVKSNRILYTPSVFAKTNLIHLQETGRLTAQKPHTSRRENLASYLFFLVEDGSGRLEYGGQIYPLQKGDCVFIDCHREYSHRSSDDLWTLQWVHFFGPNMAGIYEKYVSRGGRPCFYPQDPDAFSAVLARLYDLASSSDHVKDMKIFEQLTGLLTLLMQESWHTERDSANGPKRRSLQEVKEYLDHHFSEKISLNGLSERFFINKFYLSRIFREQFGITLYAYLMQVRITHAKQLLRFSGLSVEKVGQECGMDDANYFARTFKKIEGMPPGEYRRRWQAPR